MFELAFVVIHPVTKLSSLSSNFEIEYKQVLYGDENRSRRLNLDILTDVMVPTQGPPENVGKGTVSTGSSQKGQLGHFQYFRIFDIFAIFEPPQNT
jgi:hypothetical protein